MSISFELTVIRSLNATVDFSLCSRLLEMNAENKIDITIDAFIQEATVQCIDLPADVAR